MTQKFADAYRKGMEVARHAAACRKEIKDVFKLLDDQISTASNGRLGVKRVQLHERPAGLAIGELFSNLLNLKKYEAIAVTRHDVSGFSPREIARWTQTPAGYPCRIVAEGMDSQCEDREALENELVTLLSSVAAGEAFLAADAYVEQAPETLTDSSAKLEGSSPPGAASSSD